MYKKRDEQVGGGKADMSTDEEREFLGKRHLSFNSIAGWGGGGR